jgi:hypothetical protein
MKFADGLFVMRIAIGWLITRQDPVSGISSSFVCQGDLLRVRALFADCNIVRM